MFITPPDKWTIKTKMELFFLRIFVWPDKIDIYSKSSAVFSIIDNKSVSHNAILYAVSIGKMDVTHHCYDDMLPLRKDKLRTFFKYCRWFPFVRYVSSKMMSFFPSHSGYWLSVWRRTRGMS